MARDLRFRYLGLAMKRLINRRIEVPQAAERIDKGSVLSGVYA